MSVKNFGRGGSNTKRSQPMIKGGGVQKANIGTGGGGRKKNTVSHTGGPHWPHLPSVNSYSNAGVKGSNHSPKPSPSKPGPHYSHMPDDPTG
jgi:hypothetical protein